MPDSFGSAGVALQFVGMISSAVGAHDAAVSQKMAISAQAQMDQINARSSALAMNGQADLELINQKAGFEAMSFGSSMNMLNTQAHIFDAKSGASLNALDADFSASRMQIGAENSAAMTTLQSGTQAALTLAGAHTRAAISEIQSGTQTDALAIGAHMAEQSGNLLELQAQSTLLHGEWREQDSRMQYAQAKSRATVQMARGNLDMSEGTPLQVKVGIDVMSERAANMIQQDTLMQAFGQRTQASNSMLDAGIKRAQAQTITSMTSVQNASDLKMAEVSASTGIALGDMQAKGTVQQAQLQATQVRQQASLKTALTAMNSEFELHTAQSQSDWTAAMSHAGMLNAEAAAAYKHTMATVLETNSAASAAVKQAMADGISPNMAFMGSILGSAGQVANSWYMMNKAGA